MGFQKNRTSLPEEITFVGFVKLCLTIIVLKDLLTNF